MLQLHAVTVAGVIELRPIAVVVAGEVVGAGASPVGVDGQVIEEPERAVDPVGFVGPRALLTDRGSVIDQPQWLPCRRSGTRQNKIV
jgi:hypothetical protein